MTDQAMAARLSHAQQVITNQAEALQRQKQSIDRLMDIRKDLIELVEHIIDGMPTPAADLWRAEFERVKDGPSTDTPEG